MLVAAVVVFHLTLPAFDALGCEASPVPCRDLDSLIVYGQPRWDTWRAIQRLGVRGRESQPLDLVLDLDGVWSVVVATKDTSGNESCRSNVVGVNLTADVPPVAPVPESQREVVWFDVQGRRLSSRPTAPGIYWERRGTFTFRVVRLDSEPPP